MPDAIFKQISRFIAQAVLVMAIASVPIRAQEASGPTRSEWDSIALIGFCVGVGVGYGIAVWRQRQSQEQALTTSWPKYGLYQSERPTEKPASPPKEPAAPPRIPALPKSVFISYRREDSADITGRITDRMIQKFGRDAVFQDVDSIPLGYDFRTHLQEAVSRCDVLVAIVGRNWSQVADHTGKRRFDDPRDHLRIEIEAALHRKIPVIPVLVQGAILPEEKDLPESIASLAYRNAISIRPDPDFNGDADRLLRGLEPHLDPGTGRSRASSATS